VDNSDKKFLEIIGKKIRDLRKEKGFSSYEQFALEFDLDRKYYWSIEKGRNISLEYLKKILDIHKSTFKDFFKDINI
jgi:transcriptional regulator with XRE-family HTH domain